MRKIKDCPDSQNQLTTLLAQCFLVQKGYGEKAVDAIARDAGFQWLLGEYDIESVKNAFKSYISKNSDLPAPADIINIINPPPPKIDWALYIELKKRLREGNVYVSSDEKKFLSECEIVGVDRQRGEFKGYHEAQGKLEAHKQLMIANDSEW